MGTEIPLSRSILFVPGGLQSRIERSVLIPADILVFDLEDAVAPIEKNQARQMVVDALKTPHFESRQCVVRINAASTPWFEDDIAALSDINNCAIMLPKYESLDDIVKLEKAQKDINKKLFGLIETAAGVLAVAELVKHIGVGGMLCFGHVDFANDMGLANTDASTGSIYHARCQLAIAAHAHKVPAIDNISLEVRDEVIIRNETIQGLNLGYQGKLCIHPKQVDIVNDVYTPTDGQVSRAREILDKWEYSKERGQHVFSHENKMVDLPVVLAQKNLLARHNAIVKNNA